MQHHRLRKVVGLAIFLALIVVLLGAYTRLTDAGLGCPDWPGCYGRMVLPRAADSLQQAQTQFSKILIESRKAWTEMIHRYAAGTLALLIVFIGWSVFRKHANESQSVRRLAVALLFLVIFQAALGMWTVTLKLLPVVVMAHLLGGMLIFACLTRFFIQISDFHCTDLPKWRPWLRLACLIVLLQIALGGWVSSNYAGISCIGFPTCNGLWWPHLYFVKGFNLFSMPGVNYQGGVLDNEVRMTIQFIHRIGAVITATYVVLIASLIASKTRQGPLKIAALVLISLVLIQFLLGVLNVIYLLPISIAVAHNGVAALLLATVFSTLFFTYEMGIRKEWSKK